MNNPPNPDFYNDHSSAGLCQAAEINLIEKSLSFCAVRGALQGGPNPRWFLTGSYLAGYNGIVHASFEPNRMDESIKAALRPFAERDVPLTWWTGPSSAPSFLGVRLQFHGFIHNRDVVGMAAEIDRLTAPAAYPLPTLRLEEVTNRDSLLDWMPLYIEGFKSPPSTLHISMEMLSAVSFQRGSLWKHFMVRRQGRPIAIASLFLGGGVAGLYNLVTAPAERGKGIGTALTLQVFRFAQQMGYRVATLQTHTSNAIRLYHRLGFEVYGKFGIYQKLKHT